MHVVNGVWDFKSIDSFLRNRQMNYWWRKTEDTNKTNDSYKETDNFRTNIGKTSDE